MPRVALAMLAATGLTLATLGGAAGAPPPDKPQAAPTPDPRTDRNEPANRFQPAPVPAQSQGNVRLSAPVAAPYSGTAYRDLGGQPETSADALDKQEGRPR